MLRELRDAIIDTTSSSWRHELCYQAYPKQQAKKREEWTMIEVAVKWTWKEVVMTQSLVPVRYQPS